jgi:hypothetical protein
MTPPPLDCPELTLAPGERVVVGPDVLAVESERLVLVLVPEVLDEWCEPQPAAAATTAVSATESAAVLTAKRVVRRARGVLGRSEHDKLIQVGHRVADPVDQHPRPERRRAAMPARRC